MILKLRHTHTHYSSFTLQTQMQVDGDFNYHEDDEVMIMMCVNLCVQFLHKLTARALIRDYEDGSLDANEAEHEVCLCVTLS